MTQINLRIRKKPQTPGGVAVFCIARNELYFLPFFLAHYRAMGIHEFWFLDDKSTDGTFEYLMEQPDCAVMRANVGYGDKVYGNRKFGLIVRTLVPHQFLLNRWVLIVDADEFLFLPPGIEAIDDLAEGLARNRINSARALMLDCFPATLADLDGAQTSQSPFELNPYFDALQGFSWGPEQVWPDTEYLKDSVRPRMMAELVRRQVPMGNLLDDYGHASLHKMPLLYWTDQVQMNTSHRANVPVSDRVQLALAHFKFYPGYQRRIADAIASKAYWLASSEYRFMDVAVRELRQWPLQGPRSRRLDSAQDLVDAGLLYSHLD
ncbi:glycosyltransferase family 2 protein [Caenimonas sp. SL110]|uniref:glycosyltransferase family 2 protein n=1 Tax=Caenimonas sp. SL110 TaxID=1450524 RepID=UPI000652A9FC|nr:glycosyltransferase family 2 protein [Caenimonas sp. SL110]